MDKSNKIENLANKYVERHIRDRDSARPKGRHIMYIWFIIKR